MHTRSNNIAIVTGASKNLGRAIAIDLAKQGIQIAVHYKESEKEAKQTLKEVEKYSTGILIKADLSKEKEVALLINTTQQKLGTPHILINLVGNFIFEPIEQTTFSKWKDVIESNLYATFLCCQYVLPLMKKKGWGNVINFGCVGADSIIIREKTTPYYIAKTGVVMLTKILASAYAQYGIRINAISPGILQTSIVKTKTPTGRYATFSDILHAIHFLLQEESEYINGSNIEVAGGWRPGITGL